MKTQHGDALETALLTALVKELETKGALFVLRQGFKFYEKRFRLAYFKPTHGANSEVLDLFGKKPTHRDATGSVSRWRQSNPRHGAGS